MKENRDANKSNSGEQNYINTKIPMLTFFETQHYL